MRGCSLPLIRLEFQLCHTQGDALYMLISWLLFINPRWLQPCDNDDDDDDFVGGVPLHPRRLTVGGRWLQLVAG